MQATPISIRADRAWDPVLGLLDGPVLVQVSQDDGVILGVTSGGSAPPSVDEVIDLGPGVTVLPGLVDCHVHLCWHPGADPVTDFASCDEVSHRRLGIRSTHPQPVRQPRLRTAPPLSRVPGARRRRAHDPAASCRRTAPRQSGPPRRSQMRRLILAGSLSILALAACGAPESPGRRTAATPTCFGAPGGVPNSKGPILGIHHVSSLTRERYDAVVRQLTNGRDRLESLADGGLEGLVVHVAAQGDDGFWIIDVWESQEAVNRFGERIRPIAQAAGIREPMKTYAIQTFLAC